MHDHSNETSLPAISHGTKFSCSILQKEIKVAEHSFLFITVCEYTSFAKSWQEKSCSSQAETYAVKNMLMKDFD